MPAWREGFANITEAVGQIIGFDASVLASAVRNGALSIADFNKLATVPAGTMRLVAAYRTAVVDLATTGTHALDTPTGAGLFFYCASRIRLAVSTRDAALTTGLTFNVAQNGVALASTVTGLTFSTATLNTFAPPMIPDSAAGIMPVANMTTFPLQFIITTAVAGAGLTTCTGRLVIPGYYATS